MQEKNQEEPSSRGLGPTSQEEAALHVFARWEIHWREHAHITPGVDTQRHAQQTGLAHTECTASPHMS